MLIVYVIDDGLSLPTTVFIALLYGYCFRFESGDGSDNFKQRRGKGRKARVNVIGVCMLALVPCVLDVLDCQMFISLIDSLFNDFLSA